MCIVNFPLLCSNIHVPSLPTKGVLVSQLNWYARVIIILYVWTVQSRGKLLTKKLIKQDLVGRYNDRINKYNFPLGCILTDLFKNLYLDHNWSPDCLHIFLFFPPNTKSARRVWPVSKICSFHGTCNILYVRVCSASLLHFTFSLDLRFCQLFVIIITIINPS